jgi:hypothetical protein
MTEATLHPPLRLIDAQNRAGSRQHFYHFFFGVLLPFACHLAETGSEEQPMVIRSCGPLDSLLHELALPRLMIAEKGQFANLMASLPESVADRVTLTGFDIHTEAAEYDAATLRVGCDWILKRLATRLAEYRERVAREWPETPRIVIIDRGKPETFYRSFLSERPTRGVGSERRRVSNHEAMCIATKDRYPGARSVLLEGRSLAEQIALFQLADIMVAQHGAAISHMVWLPKNAGVIEFTGGEPWRFAFFRKLAKALRTTHISFQQEGPFGAIDPAILATALGEILTRTGKAAAIPPAPVQQPNYAQSWGGASWTAGVR